jgi:hypothetical protein
MIIRFSCVPPQSASMKSHPLPPPKPTAKRKSSHRRGSAGKFKPFDIQKVPGGISHSVFTDNLIKPCWGWPPF